MTYTSFSFFVTFSRNAFILVLLLVIPSDAKSYPKDALECYATLSPKGQLICPRDRMNFCIKEQAMMGRGECGTSNIYPHDSWDKKLKQCVYRKCGHKCPGEQIRIFNSTNGPQKEYSRNIYCCEGDLCNSSYGFTSAWLCILCVLTLTFMFVA